MIERGDSQNYYIEQDKDLSLEIGSFANAIDREKALEYLQNGSIVAGHIRGVFGLWINAADDQALTRIREAKKRNPTAKYSTMMTTDDFLDLVDTSILPEQMQTLLQDREDFKSRIGVLCHIRAPLLQGSEKFHNIPEAIYSEDKGVFFMQNLDPYGHAPLTKFIEEAKVKGMPYVGVTSMNDSAAHEPEISTLEEAKKFCQDRGIKILLTDPHYGRTDINGSFGIVDIYHMTAERDGHIPIDVIESILETELDKSHMKSANYKNATIPRFDDLRGVTPTLKHTAVILYIRGFSEEKIRNRLQTKINSISQDAA